jgi:hypothetical protein
MNDGAEATIGLDDAFEGFLALAAWEVRPRTNQQTPGTAVTNGRDDHGTLDMLQTATLPRARMEDGILLIALTLAGSLSGILLHKHN